MTKQLLLFTSLFAAVLHGMEKEYEATNCLSFTYNETEINLIKGFPYFVKKQSIIVIGSHQQRMLSGYDTPQNIGDICCQPYYGKAVWKKNITHDSASDDDTYHSYPGEDTYPPCHQVKNRGLKSPRFAF